MTSTQRVLHFSQGHVPTEMPIEINLESIFEQVISIKVRHAIAKGSVVGVNVPINEQIFSVIGRVIEVRPAGPFYELTLQLDVIPEGLLHVVEEIIGKTYY